VTITTLQSVAKRKGGKQGGKGDNYFPIGPGEHTPWGGGEKGLKNRKALLGLGEAFDAEDNREKTIN